MPREQSCHTLVGSHGDRERFTRCFNPLHGKQVVFREDWQCGIFDFRILYFVKFSQDIGEMFLCFLSWELLDRAFKQVATQARRQAAGQTGTQAGKQADMQAGEQASKQERNSFSGRFEAGWESAATGMIINGNCWSWRLRFMEEAVEAGGGGL